MDLQVIIINIFMAAFWGGVITFIIFIVINGLIMPFTKSKALRKARDLGHEVIAKRVDYKYEKGSEGGWDVWAKYEFEYSNRKYFFRDRYIAEAPKEEVLYFKKNPRKAKPITRFGGAESGHFMVFLISTGFMWLIFMLGK
ncbi:MAG: hypothetical protein IJ419_16755 [Agathobacter sp.]|nr:hypothetical protein [Agathobacter sp.]